MFHEPICEASSPRNEGSIGDNDPHVSRCLLKHVWRSRYIAYFSQTCHNTFPNYSIDPSCTRAPRRIFAME